MIGAWLLGLALAEPPEHRAAEALVASLLERARDGSVSAAWLTEAVDDPSRTSTWAAALGPGAPLTRTLAAAEGIAHLSAGPDYLRLVLRSAPTLSVVISRVGDDARLRELNATTCVRCTEPTRFALDLFAAAARGAPLLHLLQPDLHIDLEELRSLEGLDPAWAVHALSERLATEPSLRGLLAEADVLKTRDSSLVVRYGDGQRDTWELRYHDGTWRIRYHELSAESPLRVVAEDLLPLRRVAARQQRTLAAWQPTWRVDADDLIHLGGAIIGAALHEDEEALWLGLQDLDGRLAGVVRLDLTDRRHTPYTVIPTSSRHNPRTLPAWTFGMHFALSPGATHAAMTAGPTLWEVDLRDGSLSRRSRSGRRVSALTYAVDGTLVVGDAAGRITALSPQPERIAELPGPIVAIDARSEAIVALSRDARLDPDGTIVAHPAPCAAGGGGWSSYHRWWTLGCDAPEEETTFQLLLGPQRLAPWALPGGASANAAWAPDGQRWIAAEADGQAALWYIDGRPPRRLPVPALRGASWSPSGSRVLLWNHHGDAWLWNLPPEG